MILVGHYQVGIFYDFVEFSPTVAKSFVWQQQLDNTRKSLNFWGLNQHPLVAF